MPRLLHGFMAAALTLPCAEAIHTAAEHQVSVPEIGGYTQHPGFTLTRYAVGDKLLRTPQESAARCKELGDLCQGFTCNSDVTVCSVRAATMLQSSSMGEVTYQKSMDTLVMASVNRVAADGLLKLEAAASAAAKPWVVLAPSPPPAASAVPGSNWSPLGLSQQAAAPPSASLLSAQSKAADPYMEKSAGALSALRDVRAQELAKTQQQVQAAKDGEASSVTQMKAAIQQAREKSLPVVVVAAEEWTRAKVNNEAVGIETPFLRRALEAEQQAETLRQDASASTKDALDVAKNMVRLAREAEDVANHLHGAHAAQFTADMVSQDSQWKDISHQSQRLSMIAETVIREAASVANRALAQATKAEEDAHTALDRAQSNTRKLSQLKLRAEAVLNLANHPSGR